MPVGNILIGNPRGDVEHDNTTFTVDVVAVSQSSELLLAGGIPYIELEFTEVGEETEGASMNLSVSGSEKKKKYKHRARKKASHQEEDEWITY